MSDKGEPLLDLDSRRKIFRHIERNPGLHLRGLQRTLGMPLGTIEYHLHQMERSGLIVSRDDGRFKAFFAREGLDRRDKDILYYVRQEMPRQIVIQLLMEPGMSHSNLTATLPVSASTCSFHLKKLVKAEIVGEERVGRSKRFHVREADRVAGVLVRYRRSFLDDLVDRFARAWLDLGHGTAAGTQPADEDELLGSDEVQTELLVAPEEVRPDEDPASDEGRPREEQAAADGARRVAMQTSDAEAERVEAGPEEPGGNAGETRDATWSGNGRKPPGGAAAPPPEERLASPRERSRAGRPDARAAGLAWRIDWTIFFAGRSAAART